MKKLKEEKYILRVGVITFAIGVLLRLGARAISWPRSFSFVGEREDTVWGFRESALTDIGRALLIFGLIVVLLVIAKFLFFKDTEGK